MENPKRTDLKIMQFTNPQKDFITKRYVVENKNDLKEILKSFPQLNDNFMNVAKTWEESIDEGRVILVSDEHPISGFPTYCYESPKESTHLESLIRVI